MNKNLTGLVICGGGSSRMNEDKSLIDYHGVSQHIFLFQLLSEFCDNVFLSLNKKQSENYKEKFPVIIDQDEFAGSGPVTSLLSFWKQYPGQSVLCIGCDYPFVDAEALVQLLKHRKDPATCFVHEDRVPEPLVTIYEYSMSEVIMENFISGNYSLSKILKTAGAELVEPLSQKQIENVNTPDEYFLAKEYLKYKSILS